MDKSRIAALVLAGVLTASCVSLTGCGKKKQGSTNDISIASSEDDGLNNSSIDLDWPDRGDEMQGIIDAIIMANTENPDITYDVNDANSFWTYLYYVLVKAGADYSLAVDDDGDGKYLINSSAVKVYARTVFNAYDGTQPLPALPDGFDGITYDADKDSYTYWDRGITLGMSEVYAVGDKQDDGTYATVSYMIDSSDPENTVIVPWKICMLDARTSPDETPIYAYRITSVEKVEDSSFSGADQQEDQAAESQESES